jgi:hypothetical protein
LLNRRGLLQAWNDYEANATENSLRVWAIEHGLSLATRPEIIPDGHFKFPHLWPVKFLQAGRRNYQSLVVSRAMRAAASFSR